MTSIWLKLASLYALLATPCVTLAGLFTLLNWLKWRGSRIPIFRDKAHCLVLVAWVLFSLAGAHVAAWWVQQT